MYFIPLHPINRWYYSLSLYLIPKPGMDDQSWGLSYKGTIWHNGKHQRYCEPFFDTNTKIGMLLNLYTGTLTFYKNGVNLGVAFRGRYKIPFLYTSYIIYHLIGKNGDTWYVSFLLFSEKYCFPGDIVPGYLNVLTHTGQCLN